MTFHYIFIQDEHLNKDKVKNSIKIEGIKGILFSKLLGIEEGFKKKTSEIYKLLRDQINMYNKITGSKYKFDEDTLCGAEDVCLVSTCSSGKKEVNADRICKITERLTVLGTQASVQFEKLEDKFEQVRNFIEKYGPEYSKNTKTYDASKTISHKEKFTYLDTFYIIVKPKDAPAMLKSIAGIVPEDCIEKVERGEQETEIYKVTSLKLESKAIFESISKRLKHKLGDRATIINELFIDNQDSKEVIVQYLTETIPMAYQYYKESSFYSGFCEALQYNGCPLKYSYVKTQNLTQFLKETGMNKNTVTIVEYNEISDITK